MTKTCLICYGTGRSRTRWLEQQRFADCEACDGKGYTQELLRMTAEDTRRIVEHKPTWDECAEAVGVFQVFWPGLTYQEFEKLQNFRKCDTP